MALLPDESFDLVTGAATEMPQYKGDINRKRLGGFESYFAGFQEGSDFTLLFTSNVPGFKTMVEASRPNGIKPAYEFVFESELVVNEMHIFGNRILGVQTHVPASSRGVSHGQIEFFDLASGEKFGKIPLPYVSPQRFHDFVAYEVNGEWRAVVPVRDDADDDYHLRVYNLPSGEFLREIPAKLGSSAVGISLFPFRGATHIASRSHAGSTPNRLLTISNPETGKLIGEFDAVHEDSTSGWPGVESFAVNGVDYIMYSHPENGLAIVDLDSGARLDTKAVPNDVIDAIVFEYQGQPFAFINRMEGPPMIVRLNNAK